MPFEPGLLTLRLLIALSLPFVRQPLLHYVTFFNREKLTSSLLEMLRGPTWPIPVDYNSDDTQT